MASKEPIPADAPFKIKDYHSFWQACSELNPDALFLLAKILCDETVAQEYSHITGQIKRDRCSALYITMLACSFAGVSKQQERMLQFLCELEREQSEQKGGKPQSFEYLGIPLSLPAEHCNEKSLNAKLLYEQCNKEFSRKKTSFWSFSQKRETAAPSESISENKEKQDKYVVEVNKIAARVSSDDVQHLKAPEDESPNFHTLFTLLNSAKEFVEENPVPFIIVSMVVAFGITVAFGGMPIVTTLAVAGAAVAISIGCRLYGQCFFGETGYEKEGSDAPPPSDLLSRFRPRTPCGGWD